MTQTHIPDTATTAVAKAIASSLPAGDLRIDGTATPLPAVAAAMLRQMLASMAAGEPVALITSDSEMTPNEAADYLNVSRGYVTKLMDEGVLPFRLVGSHKRIPGLALIAHKTKQEAISRAAMKELVALSEEMGLYTDPQPMPPKGVYRKPAGRSE